MRIWKRITSMLAARRLPGALSLRSFLMSHFVYVIVPFLIIMVMNQIHANHVVRDQVANSGKSMAQIQTSIIDAQLKDLSVYLINLAQNNNDMVLLSGDYQGDMRHFATVRLISRLRQDAVGYGSLGNFFLIDEKLDKYYTIRDGFLPKTVYDPGFAAINGYFSSGTLKEDGSAKWTAIESDGQYFLVRSVKNGNIRVGVFVQADFLLSKLEINHDLDHSAFIITARDGRSMSTSAFSSAGRIPLPDDPDDSILLTMDKPYIVVCEPFKAGNFVLAVIVPDQSVLLRMPWLVLLTVSLLCLIVLFIPYTYILLKNNLFGPISNIILAMNRLKSGDIDTQIEANSRFREFQAIHDTFNEMGRRIKGLKIDVYEERLGRQNVELDYLRLQINPHFLLNSLNMIYGLCQTKNYQLIQKLTLSLSEYFRYMYQSDSRFMSVEKEISHVRSYLDVQEMRFPGQFTYEIEYADSLSSYEIPTLLIQTFVENCLKHGKSDDGQALHVRIALGAFLKRPENRSMIWIEIIDTGNGFPQDVLDIIKQMKPIERENGLHIGIWNAMRRVELLYPGYGEVSITNNEYFGSTVRITLPLK